MTCVRSVPSSKLPPELAQAAWETPHRIHGRLFRSLREHFPEVPAAAPARAG